MNVSFSLEPTFDKFVKLQIEGWENVNILYSIEWVSKTSYLCWKIQGTEHVFRIPTTIVYENHGLNYSDHFSLTLKTFREDYLEWKKIGFPEEWMKRYQQNYQFLIKI